MVKNMNVYKVDWSQHFLSFLWVFVNEIFPIDGIFKKLTCLSISKHFLRDICE